MVHLHTVCEFVHCSIVNAPLLSYSGQSSGDLTHDHLYASEAEPMPTVWCLEYQLYDFSSIKVATNKLGIRLVFFKSHDGEMIGFHDRVTDRSYSLQKVLRIIGIWTR